MAEKFRESFVGKYIAGPIVDTVEDMAVSAVKFPFKIIDKAIDKTVSFVRDAVLNLPIFPVKSE